MGGTSSSSSLMKILYKKKFNAEHQNQSHKKSVEVCVLLICSLSRGQCNNKIQTSSPVMPFAAGADEIALDGQQHWQH